MNYVFYSVQEWVSAGKPYNSFVCGDCMEGIKYLADKEIDLAVVDPPYGIGEDGKSNHSRSCLAETTKFLAKEWDRIKPDISYFKILQMITKNQIIWGGNYFVESLKNSPCWIVWDKLNGDTDFADCELAWTSFNSAVRKFSFRWQGMLQGDMKNKENRIHPTQKPIKLYRWLLKNYAKPGQTILDTHVGSASSLIACEIEGFEYLGFEKDQDYFNAAVERMKRERQKLNQIKLF